MQNMELKIEQVSNAHQKEVERLAPMAESVGSIARVIAECEAEIGRINAAQTEQAAVAVLRGDLALNGLIDAALAVDRLKIRIALLKAAAPGARSLLERERAHLRALTMELEDLESVPRDAPSERAIAEKQRAGRVSW